MSDAIISFPIFGENFLLYPVRYLTLFGRDFYLYGIIIAIGFALAFAYCHKKRSAYGLSSDNVFDMLICCVIGGVIGARLYYVLFNFAEYSSNLLEVFYIWNGGLAIYGGIIGGIVAMAIYSKVKKVSLLAMLDLCAPGLLIGQAIGRWGNFINREAYGASTNLPWKMGLTSITTGQTIYVHPTFLYESVWNIVGFFLITSFAKKKRKYDGHILLLYLAWYGLGRFMIEGLRADSLYLFGSSIRVSQLLAIITLVAAVVILIVLDRRTFSDSALYVNRVAMAAEAPASEEEPVPESAADSVEESEAEVSEDSAASEAVPDLVEESVES